MVNWFDVCDMWMHFSDLSIGEKFQCEGKTLFVKISDTQATDTTNERTVQFDGATYVELKFFDIALA